LINYNKWSVFS